MGAFEGIFYPDDCKKDNMIFIYLYFGYIICHLSMAELFTNQWAVQIEGGEDLAKYIAEKHGFVYVAKIFQDHYLFTHRRITRRSIDQEDSYSYKDLFYDPQVRWVEQQVAKKRVKRDLNLFNDPKWPRMWYLNRGRGLDMNLLPAWKKGLTGRGVVVSILDDGIEKDHPDIKRNYDSNASYDVNDQDPDPQPRYEYTNENRHGTRCAGEVAAEANNGICSIGVAYEASIGGVRMLDGEVTDAVEAQSLSWNPQHIHIYSASWGPEDDGQTVDGPGPLTKKAFYEGITFGRGGLGSIFVWASGNGGRDGDSCNCDGYTNSIYTLTISSATENGHVPWYSEACSSTLATTYSSGSGGERQIVTTDLRKGCTESHTGTSASAPIAAGIFALVLQANPNLTWRDMQYIVVLTSRPANLESDDWVMNGMHRKVSHHFGYGLLDVSAMVDLARNWTTVTEQRKCEIASKMDPKQIPINGMAQVTLESTGCRGSYNRVSYLEHVQAQITLSSSWRGEVEIFLTSPSGTKSTLLTRRYQDKSTDGFTGWIFMTTHCWSEAASGTWNLEVRSGAGTVTLKNWTLILFGTGTGRRRNPQSYDPVPRPDNPNAFFNPPLYDASHSIRPFIFFLICTFFINQLFCS